VSASVLALEMFDDDVVKEMEKNEPEMAAESMLVVMHANDGPKIHSVRLAASAGVGPQRRGLKINVAKVAIRTSPRYDKVPYQNGRLQVVH